MPDDSAQTEPQQSQPLTYEETPIIEPITQPPAFFPQPKRPSFVKKLFGFIGNFILFTVLFIVGVGTGAVIPQFLQTPRSEPPPPKKTIPAPTATPTLPPNPLAFWTTNEAAPGVLYKLPPDVLSPICDGPVCSSKGTYLPGGTRLTVSMRPVSLSYMQKAVITDAAGQPFTTKEASVSGTSAIEYSGLFRGTTTGGYTFSQMRGFMIGVNTAQTLEMNHFAPAGVTVDFEGDDTLFNKILQTVEIATSSATGIQ